MTDINDVLHGEAVFGPRVPQEPMVVKPTNMPFEFPPNPKPQGHEIVSVLADIRDEVTKARAKHPIPFHSAHEAWAIIWEELDEYWDEVKADRGYMRSARTELIQVAAMAVRAILDTKPS